MAMNVQGGGEEEVMSNINTTPLVDIMLVLLIIFLITVPVITQSVKVTLPDAANQPNQTKPENVIIAVDKEGKVYWNITLVDNDELLSRLKEKSVIQPQPEVQIRADKDVRYEFVGRVVVDCQRAGIQKVGFITQPEAGYAAELARQQAAAASANGT
ncbi:MAG TPA: biopolymer transporter ExbD [Steroidobacteraceae bacterium]|nr:biopolymer transporter ExbD [Steroidobacteraceae bacterium]